MIKILFVCHGNICRSAAAEVVLKQMAEEAGRRDLRIASAAATREEIGNDIYPPMKKALEKAGREDLIGWGKECLIPPYERKTKPDTKPEPIKKKKQQPQREPGYKKHPDKGRKRANKR